MTYWYGRPTGDVVGELLSDALRATAAYRGLDPEAQPAFSADVLSDALTRTPCPLAEAVAAVVETLARLAQGGEGAVIGSETLDLSELAAYAEVIRYEDDVRDRRASQEVQEVAAQLRGRRLPVAVPEPLRSRHTYVVGRTGVGKSTLLGSMILQEAAAGGGLSVVDPEAETFEERLLPFLPAARAADVVYVNPADPRCAHGLNPLYVKTDLRKGSDEAALDRHAEEVGAALSGVLGEGTLRIEQLLRQSVRALLEWPGSTLLDAARLLEDAAFRGQVIARLQDGYTRSFWEHTFPTFPKDATHYVSYRLHAFLQSATLRRTLCHRGSVDFDRLLDEEKIGLFNLSSGLLGPESSRVLGALVLAQLQLAAMRRTGAPERLRRRHTVYLDEFQTFLGTSLGAYQKLLSRGRRMGVPLVLSHQHPGQLPTELFDEIMGNVQVTATFSVSDKDARRLAPNLPLDPDRKPGQYASKDELVGLPDHHALVRLGRRTHRVHTLPPPSGADLRRADRIRERNRLSPEELARQEAARQEAKTSPPPPLAASTTGREAPSPEESPRTSRSSTKGVAKRPRATSPSPSPSPDVPPRSDDPFADLDPDTLF